MAEYYGPTPEQRAMNLRNEGVHEAAQLVLAGHREAAVEILCESVAMQFRFLTGQRITIERHYTPDEAHDLFMDLSLIHI